MGPCEGKGSDEQTLLREMLDTLQSGDILVGDAFYATYFLLCELIRGGVDGLFEQYGARRRSTDFSPGRGAGRARSPHRPGQAGAEAGLDEPGRVRPRPRPP